MLIDPSYAAEILAACNGEKDFHAMPSADVESLVLWADRLRYRAPKNANGSRARYFHAYLRRRAAKDD